MVTSMPCSSVPEKISDQSDASFHISGCDDFAVWLNGNSDGRFTCPEVGGHQPGISEALIQAAIRVVAGQCKIARPGPPGREYLPILLEGKIISHIIREVGVDLAALAEALIQAGIRVEAQQGEAPGD
jgi:hypothetical protein